VRKRGADSGFDAGTVVGAVAEPMRARAGRIIGAHCRQPEILVLHQFEARLRKVSGIRRGAIGRDAEIRVLDVRQRVAEPHFPVDVNVRRCFERRARSDQVEMHVREAGRGVVKE